MWNILTRVNETLRTTFSMVKWCVFDRKLLWKNELLARNSIGMVRIHTICCRKSSVCSESFFWSDKRFEIFILFEETSFRLKATNKVSVVNMSKGDMFSMEFFESFRSRQILKRFIGYNGEKTAGLWEVSTILSIRCQIASRTFYAIGKMVVVVVVVFSHPLNDIVHVSFYLNK